MPEEQTESAAEGIAQAQAESATPPEPAPQPEAPAAAKAEAETAPQENAESAETNAEKSAKESIPDDPDAAPIADWSKVELAIPKDAKIDEQLMASFGELAVKSGLSKKQSQALLDWQLAAIAAAQKQADEAKEAYLNEQEKTLKDAWGRNARANQDKIIALAGRISSAPGCEGFDKLLGKSGMADNALFLQGMLAVASMLDEDGLKSGAGASGGDQPETALDGIRAAFAEARANNWK